ncbi:MAG: hypothetical protein JRF59_03510 [Deltaproteobacteria bacterium]|nr:hypothetical protein [Deltaproteobacteria bacterium]MBW2102918.1 hypothetical protein [Deltaproteobacteria bacterium]MBW2346895.1 hypothetical protein [Deltaproteobacteria bacterium]
MRVRLALGLLFFCCVAAAAAGCGKKGPPVAPGTRFDLLVADLRGKWQEGVMELEGRVVGEGAGKDRPLGISGFRLFHVWYAPGEAPCEGCPIRYGGFQEEILDPGVVDTLRFRCRVRLRARPGTHFFAVALLGENGAMGPLSNNVKFTKGKR